MRCKAVTIVMGKKKNIYCLTIGYIETKASPDAVVHEPKIKAYKKSTSQIKFHNIS